MTYGSRPPALALFCLLICLGSAPALCRGQGAPPAKVVVAGVRKAPVAENMGMLGVLYFERIARISPEVAGLVRAVSFQEGDQVSRADELIRLNTDLLSADKALEESRIQQIDARIRKTRKNLERYRKLFKIDAASEIDYDNLYFSHEEMIKERETGRRQLDKINLHLEKCVVYAPFDGLVLSKSVDVGEWVIPGRTVCEIGASDDLYIKVPMAERLLRYAVPGSVVSVELNAYGEKLAGTIEGIAPRADIKTKNVTVKIRLDRPERIAVPLAENMSATVYMPISGEREMTLVPRDALVRFQGADFVYTVAAEKAAMVPVTVLAYMDEQVGIDAPNLADDAMVVVDGNERLRPDQPVQVVGKR